MTEPGETPEEVVAGLAPRISRNVVLRPPLPADNDFLYLLATTGENAMRWRYRGAVPAPDQFARQLWAGVLAQYVVHPRGAPPAGLVTIYDANLGMGTAYLAVLGAPEAPRAHAVFHGLMSIIEFAFLRWGLRKIYFETPEFNLAQFGSALTRDYLVEEGRLRAHEVIDGQAIDLVYLAIYRDQLPRVKRLVDWVEKS